MRTFLPYGSMLGVFLLLVACQPSPDPLPYYFPLTEMTADGLDTVGYERMHPFTFRNQDSLPYGRADLLGKVWVADFIFTSCPGICPTLTASLREVQAAFADRDDALRLVSFSVDPEFDQPSVLRAYAGRKGAQQPLWQFLTAPKDTMYGLIRHGFRLTALADSSAPGGIFHDQRFVLIDGEGYFRGFYFGTDEEEVQRLIADLKTLLPPS